ncbi:MAG: tetratricopeptide repeat protein, partial [Planctomycetota bacterium]
LAHPLHTETVAYVTQRTELMVAFCYFLAFLICFRFWKAQHRGERVFWAGMAMICSVVGILSKEMMVTIPTTVMLYEWTFIGGGIVKIIRRSGVLYLGLMACWPVIGWVYATGQGTPGGGFGMGMTLVQAWYTEAKILFQYAGQVIGVVPLSTFYEIPTIERWSQAWVWVVPVLLIVAVTMHGIYRRSPYGFAFGFILGVLAPTLLIPLPMEMAADRRMYIPLVAVSAVFVVGGYRCVLSATQWLPEPGRSRWAIMLLAVPVVALSILGGRAVSHRMPVFQSDFTVSDETLRINPHSALAWMNRGTMFAEAKRMDEAMPCFLRAIELDPSKHSAHFNLGLAYELRSRPEKALEHYERAVDLDDQDVSSHYNLARLLASLGDVVRAERHYQSALESEPDFAAAWANLGMLHMSQGKPERAIEPLVNAFREEPDLANCMNLVMAYSETGQQDKVLATLRQAKALAQQSGDDAVSQRIARAIAQLSE